jgi:translation initiation factor 4E
MASTLPPAAEKANANTLSEALAATSLSATPSPSSEPKELNGNDKENKDVKADDELEDGEIREDEEDDGRVKTVFDDADKFNVKVGLSWASTPECPAHV